MIPANARLCYVKLPWVWFTTREPWFKQQGDDWNDAPYELNAGEPYAWSENRGDKPYELYCVAVRGDVASPVHDILSVDSINRHVSPWLWKADYGLSGNTPHRVWAGNTYFEFCAIAHDAGWEVFEPVDLRKVTR